jgi:hypothetical protein
MPSALIRTVADYCWSHNFLDVFRNFFSDHAEAFVGAPEMHSGEHNLEYYGLFQQYLQVYEDTLTEYLSTMDHSIEDFYAEVREAQDESCDPYLRTFIDCLVASADYDSFYKVMVKEGKKRATVMKKAGQELPSAGADAKGTSDMAADAKGGATSEVADAKGGAYSEEADAKGSGGGGGGGAKDADGDFK